MGRRAAFVAIVTGYGVRAEVGHVGGTGPGAHGDGHRVRADRDRRQRVAVTVSIGVTEPPGQLSTYAIRPPGVIAMARGPAPTVTGWPGRSVATSTGVTVPEPSSAT